MTNFLFLVGLSIYTDCKFIIISAWSVRKRIEFIFKKYYLFLLLFSKLRKFELGKSFIYLFGKRIYFTSQSGLTPYQSILVHHQQMLKLTDLIKNPTIIDVGANAGFFSMLVAEYRSKSIIYAFEPIPPIFNILKNNLIERDNVHLFNMAVSDKQGTSRMLIYHDDPQHSMMINNHHKEFKNTIISVPTIDLDTFVKNQKINRVDILKIDVETFEKKVLIGALKSLSKTKYLILEITVANNNNYTFSELVHLLYSDSFNFQLISFKSYDIGQDKTFLLGDFLFENKQLK